MQNANTSDLRTADQGSGDIWYYLGVYVGMSVAIVVVGTVRYFLTFTASLRASKTMFEKVSYTVLRTPLRWLDTVPVGRILNRFTTDFNVIDSNLARTLAYFGYQVIQLHLSSRGSTNPVSCWA
jgi:ABC-type multidrug transport system fused ATPase/permease subunit